MLSVILYNDSAVLRYYVITEVIAIESKQITLPTRAAKHQTSRAGESEAKQQRHPPHCDYYITNGRPTQQQKGAQTMQVRTSHSGYQVVDDNGEFFIRTTDATAAAVIARYVSGAEMSDEERQFAFTALREHDERRARREAEFEAKAAIKKKV